MLFLLCAGGGIVIWQAVKSVKKSVNQAMTTVGEINESEASRQNLTRIGLAMHNYQDAMGSLPNNSYGPPGKQSRPLLSWRVHILPYLNDDAL